MSGQYTKKLTGILACLTILIMGGVNIFTTLDVSYDTMMYIMVKVLPMATAMGFMGFLMGNILDHPKNFKRKNKSSMRV